MIAITNSAWSPYLGINPKFSRQVISFPFPLLMGGRDKYYCILFDDDKTPWHGRINIKQNYGNYIHSRSSSHEKTVLAFFIDFVGGKSPSMQNILMKDIQGSRKTMQIDMTQQLEIQHSRYGHYYSF